MYAYTYGDLNFIYFDGKRGNDYSIHEAVYYDLTVVKEGSLITYFVDGKLESSQVV
jgi:hypothetical protein